VARYRLEVTAPAEQEIEVAEDWIAVDSPEAAERWSQGIFAALKTLDTMPARCPLAPENEDHPKEIRQLVHGRYRILFTIQPGRVVILHVRHGARLPLQAE
jgi:plasmid stabilization system protein ParE